MHFSRVMEQNDARIASPSMRKEAMDNIYHSLDARHNLYDMADARVDTSSLSVDQVVDQIVTLREKSANNASIRKKKIKLKKIS